MGLDHKPAHPPLTRWGGALPMATLCVPGKAGSELQWSVEQWHRCTWKLRPLSQKMPLYKGLVAL
jgi:hypothetical protein